MDKFSLEAIFFRCKQAQIEGRYITQSHLFKVYKSLGIFDQKIILGYSVNQKSIEGFKFGNGKTKILIWSQMHGNESTTTKSLVDFLAFLVEDSLASKSILNRFSFFIIPMLNPDGAELYTRENANGIDLNRDFLNLSQPESNILIEVFHSFQPHYCLNLHDQRSIYGVGKKMKSATVSFLSPAFNEERDINETRLKAMNVIINMKKALSDFIPNQIGRYDDTFNRNCVGDTFQSLGVPTVLFEAGHFPDDYQREKTRFFIFVALLSGITSINENDIVSNINAYYLKIPQNNPCFFDIIYRNVKISYENSNLITNFAIQYSEELSSNVWMQKAKIVSIGDLRNFKGHVEIDAENKLFNTTEGNFPFISQKADFYLGKNTKVVNGLIIS